jgi:hypothetical protein
LRIGELDVVAEAVMNNCSDLWTATAKSSERLLATAAGSSPEAALENVIERAERALAVS